MAVVDIDWSKDNILKIGNDLFFPDIDDSSKWRKKIEPWLTAVFQSDHLSLLVGSGFSIAINAIAGNKAQGMDELKFENYTDEIKEWSHKTAVSMGREKANFEDDLRTALELYNGLLIKRENEEAKKLKIEIDKILIELLKNVLRAERDFLLSNNIEAINVLKSFLISFGSRTATRERLQIFTTNYDRFIEYGCDLAVIHLLDRFVGKINPKFRASKIDLDYHYNPPGIRGEPRYVEGVGRLTKLHGSIDWRFQNNSVQRSQLPFGAEDSHPEVNNIETDSLVIFPNSSKAIETTFYPYSELFRDFASAICRPNSSLVTYGYGFGDSHINKVIEDMLTIPSTHLVVITKSDSSGRIKKFLENCNLAQFTLLKGDHFGDMKTLVSEYLPKAAIDRISERMHRIKEKRGNETENKKNIEASENE